MPAKGTGKNQGHSCKIDGCNYPAFSRGWCSMHYRRWHMHGDPLFVKQEQSRKGQGRYRRINGKNLLPHQTAYLDAHGPIPICDCEKGELYHVHHKDGYHYHDDPENLTALHPREHGRISNTVWDRCQVEGCNSKSGNKGLVGGYCPGHNAQIKTHGRITSATLQRGGTKKKWLMCIVEGCGSEGYCKGYCVRHYAQIREHGEIKHVDKVVGGTKRWTECIVDGCMSSMEGASNGYCDRHYQQMRKFGRIVSVAPIDQSDANRRGWETRRSKSKEGIQE